MKKFFNYVFALAMVFTLVFAQITPISAEENYFLDELVISNETSKSIDSKLYDGPMNIGDQFITKDGYTTAMQYAENINNRKAMMRGDTDEDVYHLSSIKILDPYNVLKTGYLRDVPVGVTVTNSSSASISIGGSYKHWNLGATFSRQTSYSYSGPSEGYIGSGARITHRVYVQVLYGTVQEATYEVRSKYTNQLLRTEKVIQLGDLEHLVYSTTASITPDGMYYTSVSNNGVAGVSNFNRFKTLVNGNGKDYLFFSGMRWFD